MPANRILHPCKQLPLLHYCPSSDSTSKEFDNKDPTLLVLDLLKLKLLPGFDYWFFVISYHGLPSGNKPIQIDVVVQLLLL